MHGLAVSIRKDGTNTWRSYIDGEIDITKVSGIIYPNGEILFGFLDEDFNIIGNAYKLTPKGILYQYNKDVVLNTVKLPVKIKTPKIRQFKECDISHKNWQAGNFDEYGDLHGAGITYNPENKTFYCGTYIHNYLEERTAYFEGKFMNLKLSKGNSVVYLYKNGINYTIGINSKVDINIDFNNLEAKINIKQELKKVLSFE